VAGGGALFFFGAVFVSALGARGVATGGDQQRGREQAELDSRGGGHLCPARGQEGLQASQEPKQERSALAIASGMVSDAQQATGSRSRTLRSPLLRHRSTWSPNTRVAAAVQTPIACEKRWGLILGEGSGGVPTTPSALRVLPMNTRFGT